MAIAKGDAQDDGEEAEGQVRGSAGGSDHMSGNVTVRAGKHEEASMS